MGVAAPFVIAWIASPAIARWTSLSPLVAGRVSVADADARALRLVARRTWRFFETFVTATDHMLPPDNFQEDPKPGVAHRTSPTNLGLYLLSAVSARDFGWVGMPRRSNGWKQRSRRWTVCSGFAVTSITGTTRSDLRPLDPKYVSSVDSGNLAGHLIALANACREWIARPVAGPERLPASTMPCASHANRLQRTAGRPAHADDHPAAAGRCARCARDRAAPDAACRIAAGGHRCTPGGSSRLTP